MTGRRPSASDLTERITLQRRTWADDALGDKPSAYADVAQMWAKVRPVSGAELLKAGQLAGASRYRITLRYRSDLTTDDRFVWRGANLNIQYIGDWGPHEAFVTVDCERGAVE
jgi:SPP1 family predicted phage head-tail adaptor